MNLFRWALCVGLLTAACTAFSQVSWGPDTGSVPSGVQVSTDDFALARHTTIFITSAEERRLKHPPMPIDLPPGVPPSIAPIGSTFQFDRSTLVPQQEPLPIVIASFAGIQQTNFHPPDPQMAAGPQHILTAVNSVFRICDKTGNTLKEIDAGQWFASALPATALSEPVDPNIRFDHFAARWIMTWLHITSTTSHYLISVSDDDNPIGTWYNWALPGDVNGHAPSGDWADFDGLGFDSQALYIATNQYFYGTGNFSGVKIRIIPKAQLYANTAGSARWTDFWTLFDPLGKAYTVRPAIVYGYPTDYYLAEIPNVNNGTYVVLYRITAPLSAPVLSFTKVPVTAWRRALKADQPGGGTLIETANSLLQSPIIYRDGSLWIAHSVASGSSNQYSGVRYMRINTVTNSAVEDMALGAEGFWYYYPAIAVDKDENVAITFSRSGHTGYPGAYMSWRVAGDSAGLHPSVLLQQGKNHYEIQPVNRWGDFMSASLDPTDGNNFWLMSEYAEGSANNWGTWALNARLVPFAEPRAFASAPSLDFGSVDLLASDDTTTVGIANKGKGQLIVSAFTNGRDEYTVIGPHLPVSLSTFESLTLRVVFTPAVPGATYDTLRVTTNDKVNPVTSVPLTGKGVAIAAAVPNTLYATSAAGELYTLNRAASTATPIGPLGMSNIQSLAIQPSTNRMYGLARSPGEESLYRIDASEGTALFKRSLPLSEFSALAFGPGDTVFGATRSGGLYRLNLANGDTARIGNAAGIAFSGLSFNRVNGKLWACVDSPYVNDSIYTVDRFTGALTRVGSTGFQVRTSSLAFDTLGNLLALVENVVATLDTANGHYTSFVPFGVENLRSLALSSPVISEVVKSESRVPGTYNLAQNYPNPFNPTTGIRYQVPGVGDVRLVVYDVLGREVATLVAERKVAGSYEVRFDASGFASGVYFYRLMAGNFSATKKMLFLR